jgi:hypothetical protein
MARGFNDTRDLQPVTSDGIPFIRLFEDISAALRDYNDTASALRASLVTVTTAEKLVTGGAQGQYNFSRATEYGRPDRVRVGVSPEVERFIPLEDFSLGVGFTRKYLALATSSDVSSQVDESIRADQELIIRMILQQTLRIENLGVGGIYKTFWNADGEIPPRFADTTFLGTHTHFFFNASLTLAVIQSMRLALVEHGLDVFRELWIPLNLESGIRGLAGFVPVASKDLGLIGNTNVLSMPNSQVALVDPSQYIGVLEGFRIRLFNWMPDNYMFAYDAAQALLRKPLAWREYPVGSLRGLQLFNEDPNSSFPLVNSFFARSFGLAALNRSNGVAAQVAASYTTPSIFTL